MTGPGLKKILLGTGILLLSMLPANAANLLRTTFAPPQVFSSTGNLKIFGSGSFTQSFSTNQTKTVMISFTSVCSISGTTNQATTINILLDGTPVYPTGQDSSVLCGAAGATTNLDGLITSSIVTARQVASGNHNIQVTVTPRNGGTSRIANLILLVWD